MFIFLTKEGDSASNSIWLSLSYASIADILEKLCEKQKSNISDDIYISIRHYIDLIRRHIMSESDIAQLCRQIYKQHRQAIDLIYEHRPDFRSSIEEMLGNLIEAYSESMNLERDDSTQLWIRFAPKKWDSLAFQKTCSGWTSSKRILLFEFWNEPQRLELKLVVGPGDIQVKKKICEKLRGLPVAGIKRCNVSPSGFNQLCTVLEFRQIALKARSLFSWQCQRKKATRTIGDTEREQPTSGAYEKLHRFRANAQAHLSANRKRARWTI
ncbi:MAG: hypothetical protein WBB01_02530 [Phormidesmis sp.]